MSELIDREATVKQICKMGEMVGGHDRDVVISIALFVQDEKTAFPTVERPQGEWIEKSQFDRLCKNCGQQHIGVKRFANFCPNCGADMRDKKDDLAEIIEAVQSIKEGESE